MPRPLPRTRIAIALLLVTAGASQALAAQPARVPASVLGARPLDETSYRSALGGLWNYRSCGYRVRAGDYAALDAQLRSIEAAARAKGLGPTLDRVRQEYQAILAVSTMMACAGGPAAALAGARQSMAAFQAWVAGASAVMLTPAQQEAEVVREIAALEEAHAAAEIARDDAVLRQLLEAQTDPDKAPAIEERLRATIYREAITERHVALHGDEATVTGIVALTYAAPPDRAPARFRFTETYRSTNGIWRLEERHLADQPLP